MAIRIYHYPNCSTCKKALKWLDENQLPYEAFHIVEDTPSEEDLTDMVEKSEIPVRKFFNTSGKRYRELNLKEKLPDANEEEMIQMLAADGMLIKRPLVTDGTSVTVGFKEETFEKHYLN